MGLELKRVPLGFEWPLHKVWAGFKNPHYDGHCGDCPDCQGRGSTTALRRLQDLVRLLLLSSDDAMSRKLHPYFAAEPFFGSRNSIVSEDIIELTGGLAGRPPRQPFGHDSIDEWAASKKIIGAAGLKKSWGICKACKGEGSVWDSPENRRRARQWRRRQPPKGKGYQIWETVSEGSPISPVFASPEELANWMAEKDPRGETRDHWLRFINGPGWAPSMVGLADGRVVSGVEAVTT